ncbi:hypothetical protein V8E36_008614 [Tilletia maclaganii]
MIIKVSTISSATVRPSGLMRTTYTKITIYMTRPTPTLHSPPDATSVQSFHADIPSVLVLLVQLFLPFSSTFQSSTMPACWQMCESHDMGRYVSLSSVHTSLGRSYNKAYKITLSDNPFAEPFKNPVPREGTWGSQSDCLNPSALPPSHHVAAPSLGPVPPGHMAPVETRWIESVAILNRSLRLATGSSGLGQRSAGFFDEEATTPPGGWASSSSSFEISVPRTWACDASLSVLGG